MKETGEFWVTEAEAFALWYTEQFRQKFWNGSHIGVS